MVCSNCGNTNTSEYMENRWMCLACGAKFVYEPLNDFQVEFVPEKKGTRWYQIVLSILIALYLFGLITSC